MDVDVSVEEIFVVFKPHFDKNGWKYKAQIDVEFQSVFKSLYTQVLKKVHVLNDTLSLEFARVVVAKNKKILVNWAAYEYSTYRRQRSLETARKTWHENLL
jgi:hypothetical protein